MVGLTTESGVLLHAEKESAMREVTGWGRYCEKFVVFCIALNSWLG